MQTKKLSNKEIKNLLKKHPQYKSLQVLYVFVILSFVALPFLINEEYSQYTDFFKWTIFTLAVVYTIYLRKNAVKIYENELN